MSKINCSTNSKNFKAIAENEPDVENGTPALIADLSARGVWDRHSAASFDIRATDTDAPSYQNRNPMNVLKTAEIEKKSKYGTACEEKHMSFTPLVTSIDGVLAQEFKFFLKRLAGGLASKWDRPYSHVMCWVRCRISFAILRATKHLHQRHKIQILVPLMQMFSKNMRCLKIKTQDDNCEQATKKFSLHHSKPIYFDFKLNLHCCELKKNFKAI